MPFNHLGIFRISFSFSFCLFSFPVLSPTLQACFTVVLFACPFFYALSLILIYHIPIHCHASEHSTFLTLWPTQGGNTRSNFKAAYSKYCLLVVAALKGLQTMERTPFSCIQKSGDTTILLYVNVSSTDTQGLCKLILWKWMLSYECIMCVYEYDASLYVLSMCVNVCEFAPVVVWVCDLCICMWVYMSTWVWMHMCVCFCL